MNDFIVYIKSYIELSEDAEQAMGDKLRLHELKKGEKLQLPGKVYERLYFLAEGTIRTFFYQDGKDITYWIYPNPTMLTSWNSYLLKKTSSEYLEATEDATLFSLTYDQWQELYLHHRELERFSRLVVEEQFAILDDFYKGYYFMSAKEKYDLLIQFFPDITQRANLGHIASMLGVSQETLSRVRSL